jgi:hypothetical protein
LFAESEGALIMRAIAAATVGVLIVMQTVIAPAQTKCSVHGPPYGPTGYVGDAGYKFDYWSQAGTVKGENFYQPGIKNLGSTPLTIDWRDAGYFRRGIASGKEAPGTCGSDRNPLNTASGLIRYGPNANFDGPVAKFFTRSGAQASRSSRPIDFLVDWESILDSGEKYLAQVLVGAASVGPISIRYTFTNTGRPVELDWAGVLTDAALARGAESLEFALVQEGFIVGRQFDTGHGGKGRMGRRVGVGGSGWASDSGFPLNLVSLPKPQPYLLLGISPNPFKPCL